MAVRKILPVTDINVGACSDFVQRTTIERIANFGCGRPLQPPQAVRL